MKQGYAQEWPQFFTATIQRCKHLLKEDKYKNIIVDALNFLVTEGNVTINGLVPIAIAMPNHLHIIWQAKANNDLQKIQNSFIKHASKEFKKLLAIDNNLQAYEVNAIGRKYNFWQSDSLNIELFISAVFQQKLIYIHYNAVKANLYNLPQDYHFSSALFYEKSIDHFSFIDHYL